MERCLRCVVKKLSLQLNYLPISILLLPISPRPPISLSPLGGDGDCVRARGHTVAASGARACGRWLSSSMLCGGVGASTNLARMLVPAEALATALIPIVAPFSSLGISPCLRECLVKGPFVAGRQGGVPADEDHLLQVTSPVSPSCGVVRSQGYPLPVEGEMENPEGLQGVGTVDCVQKIRV